MEVQFMVMHRTGTMRRGFQAFSYHYEEGAKEIRFLTPALSKPQQKDMMEDGSLRLWFEGMAMRTETEGDIDIFIGGTLVLTIDLDQGCSRARG